ncbi:MAG: hypothetical protein RL266_1345 [Bacteroidota bacterium]|jgi:uncharacterized membrane protein YhhN
MLSSNKNFGILYYGVALLLLTTIVFELQVAHYIVKPMFMVLLMAFQYVQLSGKMSTFTKLVQFGLFFSWIGDIALMFDEQVEILFVVGLAAFLIAHLGYAYAFIRNVKDSPTPFNMGSALLMAVPFAAFTGAFFYYIKDGLPENLFVPVLAYTVVISVMGITSAWRKGHVQKPTYTWVLVGAVLFILSDCVIAVNKFVVDFDYDAVLNMTLYLSGQFMITLGAVLHEKK